MDDEGNYKSLQTHLEVLQVKPPFHQTPVTIMQSRINDRRNANFLVKIVGMGTTALYDTGANLSCISYRCLAILKDPPILQDTHAFSVHFTVGNDLTLWV